MKTTKLFTASSWAQN